MGLSRVAQVPWLLCMLDFSHSPTFNNANSIFLVDLGCVLEVEQNIIYPQLETNLINERKIY